MGQIGPQELPVIPRTNGSGPSQFYSTRAAILCVPMFFCLILTAIPWDSREESERGHDLQVSGPASNPLTVELTAPRKTTIERRHYITTAPWAVHCLPREWQKQERRF